MVDSLLGRGTFSHSNPLDLNDLYLPVATGTANMELVAMVMQSCCSGWQNSIVAEFG